MKTNHKIILFVLIALAGASLAYFLLQEKPKETVVNEEQPQQEIVEKVEQIFIRTQPKIDEILDNTLTKRIDYINKLIADFDLNGYAVKTAFAQTESGYQELTPSYLLKLNIQELGSIRSNLEANGVYFKNNNEFLPREEYIALVNGPEKEETEEVTIEE